MTRKTITFSIVDDDATLRQKIGVFVGSTPGFRCVSQYESAEEALRHLPDDKPDVALMDINLGGMSGIDALRPIRSLAASVHVFVMTTFYDGDVAARAFSLGASGFILKRQEIERTVECIRRVSAEAVPKSQWRASVRQTAVHWPWVAQVMHARPLLMRAIGVLRTFL